MSKREPGEDSTLGTPDRSERHPYKKEVNYGRRKRFQRKVWKSYS